MTESASCSRPLCQAEAMCEKCVQYDDKIARYRRLSLGINDRQTLDGIAVLIAQATDAKALIHPSPPEKQGSQ